MKTKLVAGVALATVGLISWAAKDSVVMTVNGVDVPLSEFEYLYNKNAEQQLAQQSVEEYAELFGLYKQKVADAKSEGIDTTESFRREMEQYRHDLAKPYLVDSVFLNKLVDQAYERSKSEVEFKHIMLRKNNQDDSADFKAYNTADSLLKVLSHKGADFEALANEYSQDPASASKGGSIGYITILTLPYELEKTAFDLKPGQVAKKVVESPVAYHVIVGGERRPARGSVMAAHIMKMVPPTATEAEHAKAKAEIDSIYTLLLQDPGRFEDLAVAESDDRGSSRNGGMLPKFSAGQMVPEFDQAAFALADNEISSPVRSQYGWHIIKKIASFEPSTREQLKPALLNRFNSPQDGRSKLIRANQTEQLARKHKSKLNQKVLDRLYSQLMLAGLDSAYYQWMAVPEIESLQLTTIDKTPVKVGELAVFMRNFMQPSPRIAAKVLTNAIDNFYSQKLIAAEENWLLANKPDYRNLMNEYTEGSMLFEVMNQKVWDRAAKDLDGLKKYFENNKGNYAWPQPRVKGYLIQTANDSISELVKQRLVTLGGDTIVRTINQEFPKLAKAEYILVKQGENAMVDNLMFGAEEVVPKDASMTRYFLFNERLLNIPEVYSDVRGQVTSDYQNELEDEWVKELKSRYPVVIYKDVLDRVKKRK